jgi:hypothetical protein
LYLGSWKIDDTPTFSVTTHRFDTGAATDADSPPTYRVYEDETSTPILTGTMALLDSSNTAGLYSEQITLSAANGFEKGKSYSIYITAAVNSVTGTAIRNLQIGAEVDVRHAGGTAWGSGAITAASIATDAITDAKVASDVTIASVTGAVGSVTGAVGSVTGNVGGNVTGSVGSVATGGIVAASFAADAITAAKIAADVTTEIQAGLATAAALTTVSGKIDVIDGIVDDILVDTAEIGAAGAGLTNINLPNQTMDIVGNITGNLSGSVGSVTGAVGSVTGAVGSVTGLTASDVGAIKTETDKLADTLEDDAGTYRFTTNALEQAPSGGGGGTTDWTADERTSIRSILGIPGSGTTPADPSTGILDTIRDSVATRASQTSVDDLPTNAELATSQASADDATLAAIAALNNLSAAQVNAEVDTALADVGLTTTITNRIDAAVSTRATPAQVATELGTYDAPTKAELDAAVALLATAANLAAAKVVVDAIKVKTDLIPTDPAETSDIPSAATVAAAVLAAAASNPIDANVQEINDTALTGDGNSTPWGPAA